MKPPEGDRPDDLQSLAFASTISHLSSPQLNAFNGIQKGAKTNIYLIWRIFIGIKMDVFKIMPNVSWIIWYVMMTEQWLHARLSLLLVLKSWIYLINCDRITYTSLYFSKTLITMEDTEIYVSTLFVYQKYIIQNIIMFRIFIMSFKDLSYGWNVYLEKVKALSVGYGSAVYVYLKMYIFESEIKHTCIIYFVSSSIYQCFSCLYLCIIKKYFSPIYDIHRPYNFQLQ